MTRQQEKICKPFSRAVRGERHGILRGIRDKRVPHVVADLERKRPDTWPEESEEFIRRSTGGVDGTLDYAARQAAPAGMRDRNDATGAIGKQDRNAVGDEYGTNGSWRTRNAGISLLSVGHKRIGIHDFISMHLFQPPGLVGNGISEPGPVSSDRSRIIAGARSQVQARIRARAESAGARRDKGFHARGCGPVRNDPIGLDGHGRLPTIISKLRMSDGTGARQRMTRPVSGWRTARRSA